MAGRHIARSMVQLVPGRGASETCQEEACTKLDLERDHFLGKVLSFISKLYVLGYLKLTFYVMK